MLSIDYFVATYPDNAKTQSHLVRIESRVVKGIAAQRLGYAGGLVNGLFFGRNRWTERTMIQATGGVADTIIKLVPEAIDDLISVARIDIAVTTISMDADAEIDNIGWKGGYKVTKYENLTDRGKTLYIGAPKSRARLRIYNKSAEAGITREDGREYIRYELQLRDSYADSAFKAYRLGKISEYYLSQVMRMLDQKHYKMLSEAINAEADGLEELFEGIDEEKAVQSKLVWLERTVIPALNKLLTAHPEVSHYVNNLLDKLPINKV